LLNSAKDIKQQGKQKEAIQAEKKRIEELKKLSFRQEQVWLNIDNLIKQTKAKYYTEAVELLIQLKDLAIFEGKEPAFQDRFKKQVYLPYKRKTSFKQMLIIEFNFIS
jgi:hypothetical protein